MNNNEKEICSEIVGFHEEIGNIQEAIADFESGHNINVAIISAPLAGRTKLIDEIEKKNSQKVTRINFSSIVRKKDDFSLSEKSKKIVLVDDCQFFYMRKINGFDILQHFLDIAASPDHMLITTWNLYSWTYLNEIIRIGDFFPVQIYVPKLNSDQIKELILSGYEKHEIKFIDDEEFENKIIEFPEYPLNIKFLKKKISITYLKINFSRIYLTLFRKKEKLATEDIIFRKIHRISNGNPGVAKIIWEKSLDYPVIKPGRIKDYSYDIDLDYNESFIINIIMSMESINCRDLSEIAGPNIHIDRIIFKLSEQRLIFNENDACRINPEAINRLTEYLKKLRLVW